MATTISKYSRVIGLPYHQPYAPVLDLAGTPGMHGAYLWTCRQTLLMQATITGRRLLQDGRIVFDADVLVTPATKDKPAVTKAAVLLLTAQQLQTLQLLGEATPKVGVTLSVNWSVDQYGQESDKWLSL